MEFAVDRFHILGWKYRRIATRNDGDLDGVALIGVARHHTATAKHFIVGVSCHDKYIHGVSPRKTQRTGGEGAALHKKTNVREVWRAQPPTKKLNPASVLPGRSVNTHTTP
jgi:hypothetical protein